MKCWRASLFAGQHPTSRITVNSPRGCKLGQQRRGGIQEPPGGRTSCLLSAKASMRVCYLLARPSLLLVVVSVTLSFSFYRPGEQ